MLLCIAKAQLYYINIAAFNAALYIYQVNVYGIGERGLFEVVEGTTVTLKFS